MTTTFEIRLQPEANAAKPHAVIRMQTTLGESVVGRYATADKAYRAMLAEQRSLAEWHKVKARLDAASEQQRKEQDA